MDTFEREELLSVLSDARAALGDSKGIIPELSHFWFDSKYVYAYDGGLGIRLGLKTELDCGVPGKLLLDILRTSALKQVSLEIVKSNLVVHLGKSKVTIATLPGDRNPWEFPDELPRKTVKALVLTERIIEALELVSFVKTSKADKTITPKVIHLGVTFIPQKSVLELYTTDSRGMAQAVVEERPATDVPTFLAPWEFVDQVLKLIEPGATLHVLDKCLMVGMPGTLICSNLLELPEAPDLPKTLDRLLSDLPDAIALPAGIQPILDRANILAGSDDPTLTFVVKDSTLQIQGKYQSGALDEKLPVKGKMPAVTTKLDAGLLVRGLGKTDTFALGKKAMVLYGGDNFLYVMAAIADRK